MNAIEVISEAIDAYDVLGDSWGRGAKARVRLADLEALVTAADGVVRYPDDLRTQAALAAAVARVKGDTT